VIEQAALTAFAITGITTISSGTGTSMCCT
jgi:hypothetical protein